MRQRYTPAMLLLFLGCHPSDKGSEALLQAGEIVTCAEPSLRELGPMGTPDVGDDWASQAERMAAEGITPGTGLVVADFNQDGQYDVFLPNNGQDWLFMARDDGTLYLAVEYFPTESDNGTSASAADVDGDGDLDLYVGNIGENRLYLNDGTGHFSLSADAGVTDGDYFTYSSAFGDMDGDGDLDLFVANHTQGVVYPEMLVANEVPPGDPNALFENLGDGTFIDVSDRLTPAARDGYSIAAGWHDLDVDGDADLYILNDFGPYTYANVTLLNDGSGQFTEVNQNGLDVEVFGMGLGPGDLNEDNIPDFLVSSWGEVLLLQSAPDGTWYETGRSMGLALEGDRHIAWGVELADMDNSQTLDAVVAFGKLDMPDDIREDFAEYLGFSNTDEQPDALYLQEDGAFTEVSAAWGMDDPAGNMGFVLVDLNHDGYLDQVNRDHFGPAQIHISQCGDQAWLGVSLEMPGPNRFGVGARVTVEAGGAVATRWIWAGSSNVSSGGPPWAHFGLGEVALIDKLTVWWPDGVTSEFVGVLPNREVTVVRTE